MIIFCEDCGKRNNISDEQIVKRRAVFECSECGYPNNFALRTSQIPAIKRFTDTLKKDIAKNRATIGAFVYGRENCIISQMPKTVKPKEIDILARYLIANYHKASGELKSLCEMSVTIGSNTISLIKNRHNFALVVVCRKNVDAETALGHKLLNEFNELKA